MGSDRLGAARTGSRRNGGVCLAGHGGQCRELQCPGNSRGPGQEPAETDDDVLWNFWKDLIDTSVR